MGTNVTNEGGISRRSFLGGVAGVGALAAMGLAGCSPKAAGTTGAESASSSASAATGVADNNAVAVDDGSAAITVDWLGAPPEIGDITETKDTDLLIVGAGNGGMIAGAYASDQKMDFILCEKGTEVGATRHWFNAVDTKPFTDQGYHTDRARLHGEWARYSSGTCDHNLINMWMNESNDMFEYVDKYMSEAGAVVIADEFEMPGGMGATPFYTPCGEHHYGNAEGGRDGVPVRNELFEKVMNDNGYEISYNHELVKLVTEDSGKVTGAIFKTDNGYTQINAKKGVLLTTGGYSANPAMLSSLSPITTASVTALGYNQNNTGDGIKAALWAGAVKDITSATMIFDRGLVAPGTTAGYTEESVKAGNPQWPGNGQFNPGTQPFLKVNLRGRALRPRVRRLRLPAPCGRAAARRRVHQRLGRQLRRRRAALPHPRLLGRHPHGRAGREEGRRHVRPGQVLREGAGRRSPAEGRHARRACRQAWLRRRRQEDVPRHLRALQRAVRQPGRRRLRQGALPPLRAAHPAVLRRHAGRHAAHHHRRHPHQRRLPGAQHRLRAHRGPVLRRRLLGVALQRQLPRPDARRRLRPHDDRGLHVVKLVAAK